MCFVGLKGTFLLLYSNIVMLILNMLKFAKPNEPYRTKLRKQMRVSGINFEGKFLFFPHIFQITHLPHIVR